MNDVFSMAGDKREGTQQLYRCTPPLRPGALSSCALLLRQPSGHNFPQAEKLPQDSALSWL